MTITAIQSNVSFASTGTDFANVLGNTEPKTLAEQIKEKQDALAAAKAELRETSRGTLVGNLKDDIAALEKDIAALKEQSTPPQQGSGVEGRATKHADGTRSRTYYEDQ